MDHVAIFNQDRWDRLTRARALFTRPWLDLDPTTALRQVDPWGYLGDVRDTSVLCLASGGGQQSAAFAVSGARVTVFDLSAEQLARDRDAAAHYGYEVVTVQGDMRDLSVFAADQFDLVFHPYSINFVPDCRIVFREVARVLRPGGLYHVQAANPYAVGMGTHSWNGHAYELDGFYEQGAEIEAAYEEWVFDDPSERAHLARPREYRHVLGTLINGLLDQRFVLERFEEDTTPADPTSPPGSWDHFQATIPPWLFFWARSAP